eukprot:gnl/TRDRNA2_/TRDRNA2_198250_c0_seq1.p1 gnl/TRDRNA2_/TRDRNA2_198250_c0~~gnl/TRDRNA2_/TRDRNA2_198250_c0_seq1.p1  ORF type:complete len:505 (+),score=71.24 gnl/TRDRNA2_/TRDRNA2_198250_c0_seq1:68-1516(+)
MAAADIPIPFEALWGGTLSRLTAAELAAASGACRLLRDGVTNAVEQALEPLFVPSGLRPWKPATISWAEALHRATERPCLLVVGGEDAADMPQLRLSLHTLRRAAFGSGVVGGDSLGLGCSLPSGRYMLGATRVGPIIYVTGGTGPEGDPCPEVLRFDTLSHRWVDTDEIADVSAARGVPPKPALLPTPRYGHEAVSVLGRYLLCIGGKAAGLNGGQREVDVSIGNSTDVLDTATGRWATLPCRLECPRVYFGAVAIENLVVVAGGMALAAGGPSGTANGSLEGRLSSTEVLDATDLPRLFEDDALLNAGPPQLCWHRGPSLLRPRYSFSLAGPIAGHIFAVGGRGAPRIVETLELSSLKAYLQHADTEAMRLHGESVLLQGPSYLEAVHDALLHQGWDDLHARAAAATDGTAGWKMHPVDLPDGRSGGNAVAVGNLLCFAGGSVRTVLFLEEGARSWEPLGVELDVMRLGARVVAFGDGAL